MHQKSRCLTDTFVVADPRARDVLDSMYHKLIFVLHVLFVKLLFIACVDPRAGLQHVVGPVVVRDVHPTAVQCI